MKILRWRIAVLLALAVCLCVPPVVVRAEETWPLEPVSDPPSGVAETWQQKIDKGTVSITINSPVELDRDFVLPNGVNLRIKTKGRLIIPEDVCLTLEGYFTTVTDGAIVVEPGGRLVCNSGISIQSKGSVTIEEDAELVIGGYGITCSPGSTLRVQGSYEIGKLRQDFSVANHWSADAQTTVSGISRKDQGMYFHIQSQQDLESAVTILENADYFRYFLEIGSSLVLSSDLVIPENTRLSYMAIGGTLTIPQNVSLINRGNICIYEESTIENYGILEQNGSLWVYGRLQNGSSVTLNQDSYTHVGGTVRNEAVVYAQEGSVLELEGSWEGPAPVSPDTEHTHAYTAYVTAPTCTEKGYTAYICQCGDTYVDAYLDALGHDYAEGTITLQPGCETEGILTYVCRNDAAHVKTEPVSPTGHQYTEQITAATCTQPGQTMSVCENCGDSYLSAYQEATGHHYDEGTILTSPGCETEGLICYVCLNDETHSFAQILPATGHTYQGSICISCGHTLPGAPDHDGALGDVNHDGKINAKDATLILQKSVGVLKDTAKFCEDCAEVSGDGKLNAKDSTLILQFSVGLRDSFPADS